jgi:O-antigen ligase
MLGALVFNLAVVNGHFTTWMIWVLTWAPLLNIGAMMAAFAADIDVFAQSDRFAGFASNPIIVMQQSVIALALLTPRLLALRCEKWWLRPILLVYAVATIGVIASTGTRAALVILPIMAVTTLWLRWTLTWRNWPSGFFTLVFALLLFGAAAAIIAQLGLLDVLLYRVEGDDIRLQLWEYYLGHLLSNPLGYGFGFESIVDTQSIDLGQRLPPHNAIVQAGMYSGMVGIFMVLLILWMTWRVIVGLRRSSNRKVPLYQQGLILAWVTNFGSFMFGGVIPADFNFTILTALILASAANLARTEIWSHVTQDCNHEKLSSGSARFLEQHAS